MSSVTDRTIPAPPRMFTNPEEQVAYNELLSYIQRESRQHRTSALLKSAFAQGVVLIAIVSSTLAAVNVAATTELFPKGLGAVFAVVPGAALLLARTFKWEGRARWHKLKQRKLEGFYRELRFQGASVPDVSKRLTATLERLDALRAEVGIPDL